jgi:molybdopterin synthase sulfur carrier subunit
MINIIFFAKYREQFGASTCQAPAAEAESVQKLIKHLQSHFPERTGFLSDQKLIISINQELAKVANPLKDGDVVAFFPPVTGG